ncbi:MAG: dehydrogenase [Verrucomicrobiales bacterium]|nr:dehydrogenase [Verrucomicrobiales bacterium]|tara:strand:- start:3806 stop:4564 length:759 start_codon:yes stop_codon:yes gene_type:complete
MKLQDKIIIVTGGTSGIGEACTRHFAEQGAKVVCASIQTAEGEALAAELDVVTFVHTDVSDEESVKALIAKTVELHGRVDAVHCNAGVWAKGEVTDFNEADWNKVMGVNVKGVFWTAKHAVPELEKAASGVLLLTTSVASQIGFPAHALYCASKAALEAMVRCLATDHAGKVRVLAISPGTIDTPMLAASCQGWDKPVAELYADVEKKIPVRRLGQPIDIAKSAAFLISDDAGYINGTVLVLDGGTMGLPPW